MNCYFCGRDEMRWVESEELFKCSLCKCWISKPMVKALLEMKETPIEDVARLCGLLVGPCEVSEMPK